MQVERSINIEAPPLAVWSIVSDIEKAESHISGIKKIEILEQAKGPSIVGLKWRETREFMGKDAVEVMWVTHANDPEYYDVRAESHGCIYISRLELSAEPDGTRLTMRFTGQPITFGAKIMWALTGWLAKKALRKTIDQDLRDIKEAAEKAI